MLQIINKEIFSLKYFLIQASAIALSVINGNLAAAIGGLCVVWMFKGPLQVMQSLTLLIIIKHLNPGLVEHTLAIGLVGWAAVLFAGVRALVLFGNDVKKVYVALVIFCFIVALITPINSPHVSISFLKLFSFFWFTSAVIICAYAIRGQDAVRYKTWLFTFYLAIILLSIPLYFMPSIGYFRNGTGFQGITSHPQVFGPFLSPLAAWIFVHAFMKQGRISILLILCFSTLVVLIYTSEARTALLALGLSLISTYLVYLFRANKFDFHVTKATFIGLLSVIALTIMLLFSQTVSTLVSDYVFKRGEDNIADAYGNSRGSGAASQIDYFKERPVIGNGFGVYASGAFKVDPVYLWGIPISAPVEKGVLPTMILEEVGIVGMLGFIIFIVVLSREVIINNDSRFLAMYFACLFVNLSEAVLFAVNGISQWYWGLIVLALTQRYARR